MKKQMRFFLLTGARILWAMDYRDRGANFERRKLRPTLRPASCPLPARGNAELASRKSSYEERIRSLESDRQGLVSVIEGLTKSVASLAESNKAVQPLINELSRMKGERDGFAKTNRMLDAQFKTLLSAVQSGAVYGIIGIVAV